MAFRNLNFFFCFVMLSLIGVTRSALAQEELTAEQKLELQKKLQNPVANVQPFPFQNNFDFGYGPEKNMRYTLNISRHFQHR